MHIIEYFDETWIRHSYHNNLEFAEINGEVLFKSRGCQVRMIKDGKIIAHWGDI